MMDGVVRTVGTSMSKEYIARDPRTGLPIQTGRESGPQGVSYEPVKGPWSMLLPADMMSLAEGTLDERSVRWNGQDQIMRRKDGVRALSNVPQHMMQAAHRLLLRAFEDPDHRVRIAALEVLPEFAVRKSDELFDWLSVLLDDEHAQVRKAASESLARAAPTFPSGVRSSLENELRSADRHRSACAWRGLEALTNTWPDVVAEHVDTLLLEHDVVLRRKAAKLLNTIVARKTSAVWDLVSWSLADEDVQVRRTVAKSLPKLAKQDVRMGTVLAERAITDTDADVRLAAIRTIERLNRGHGRARDLIIAGTRADDIRVRRACIALLPKITSEDELRTLCDDLLKTESDKQLADTLRSYQYDAALEGTEAEKNAALSPALPVPELDKEILLAEGKRVGMLDAETPPARNPSPSQSNPQHSEPEHPEVATSTPRDSERRPTQDELMGYYDDDDDFEPDDGMDEW